MVARRVLVTEQTKQDDKVVATVQGLAGEEFDSEVYQIYGLSANPKGENESIVIENNASPDNYVVLPPCGYEQAEEGETLIYSGKTKISIKEKSITIIIGGSKKMEIKEEKIVLHGDVEVKGKITATGDVIAGAISLQRHIHSGVYPGPSTTSQPIPGG